MDNKSLTYDDIPPEDKTLCNNAEGCDNCKWNVVCFAEGEVHKEPEGYERSWMAWGGTL